MSDSTPRYIDRVFYFLLFGISLQTYYFYSVSMPLISVASLLVMSAVFFSSPAAIKLPMNAASGVVVGYIVLLCWSGVGVLLFGDTPDTKRFIGFLIAIVAAVMAVALFRRVSLEHAVKYLLMVHVGFLYFQLGVYHVTGYLIDFLAPITGEAQRTYGSLDFSFTRQLIRPVGLFNEPGTYSTFIAPFVALFGRWYANSTFNRRLYWVSLLSLFVTLSLFGIIFGAVIFLLTKHVSVRSRVIGLVAGLLIASPYLYFRLFVWPSLGIDSGVGFRMIFVQESLRFLWTDPLGFIFGATLLVIDPRAAFVGAFNDVGLLLYLAHFSGPFLTLALVAVLLWASSKLDWPARIALLIVFVSKHSPFAPFFPFILAAILWPAARAATAGAPTAGDGTPGLRKAASPY